MPIDCEEAKKALDRRKKCEGAFNLMKKRKGFEEERGSSQHALMGIMTFTMITRLLIEMVGCCH
ncbi:MAG: hypothetical protein CSA33_02265 [Desulfobulbus propionicus]|nr:MAG: hypothetical protein CSA33_02265 [Desulfobulbus propionicus]